MRSENDFFREITEIITREGKLIQGTISRVSAHVRTSQLTTHDCYNFIENGYIAFGYTSPYNPFDKCSRRDSSLVRRYFVDPMTD